MPSEAILADRFQSEYEPKSKDLIIVLDYVVKSF